MERPWHVSLQRCAPPPVVPPDSGRFFGKKKTDRPILRIGRFRNGNSITAAIPLTVSLLLHGQHPFLERFINLRIIELNERELLGFWLELRDYPISPIAEYTLVTQINLANFIQFQYNLVNSIGQSR